MKLDSVGYVLVHQTREVFIHFVLGWDLGGTMALALDWSGGDLLLSQFLVPPIKS